MGKVVSFSDVLNKKMKEKEEELLIDEAYFFNFNDGLNRVRVEFGGAFVRDIIEKKDKNRDLIWETLEKGYSGVFTELEGFIALDDVESVRGNSFSGALRSLEQDFFGKLRKCLDSMSDSVSFSNMMSDDSEHLEAIPIVLSCLVYCSYSEFDMKKMIKENWLSVDKDVDEFLFILKQYYKNN